MTGSSMTSLRETHLPTALVVLTGVFSHILFNKLEPRRPTAILSLLLIPPIVITTFLHQFYPKFLLPFSVFSPLYLGALLTSVVAYRVSPFHPLARFPGPIICKITRLWAFYIVSTGGQHRYYQSLHAKYGTHVRTGPNHLHICDAAAIPTILGPKGFPRSARYELTTSGDSQGSLIHMMDVHAHASRRRIWDRSMNTNAIQGYQGMLTTRVNQLVEAIESQHGMLDLSMWLSCFSFDFMGDLAFGGSFHLMEQGGDPDGYTVMGRQNAKSFELFGTVPWIKIFDTILLRFSGLQRLIKFAADSVIARKSRGSATKDIFYYLLDEEGVGSSPLNLPTLIAESVLAIGAGSDTVGSALANIFFILISRPEILATLKAELDEAFPGGSDGLTSATLVKLTYLNAVINETLRLWPPLPGGITRYIPRSAGGAMIAERWVPHSTTVQVHMYSVHRDSRYFSPGPETFRPERWLDPGYTHDQAAYTPFGYGPMNCAGKNLALQELRIVTAALVRKFEFTFAPGWDVREWEKNLQDIFVLSTGRMPVLAKLRQ